MSHIQEKIWKQYSTSDETLNILDLLDERADGIGRRLEQNEVKMGEIRREDKAGKKALAGVAPARIQSRPNQVSERRYRCQLGWVMLLMGVLGVFVLADGKEVKKKRLAY